MCHWTVPSGGGLRNGVFDAPGRPQAVGAASGVLSLPCRVRRHSPSGTPALLMLVDTAHRGQPPKACHQARLSRTRQKDPTAACSRYRQWEVCLARVSSRGARSGSDFRRGREGS